MYVNVSVGKTRGGKLRLCGRGEGPTCARLNEYSLNFTDNGKKSQNISEAQSDSI